MAGLQAQDRVHSEVASGDFRAAVESHRIQLTSLEECWRASFAGSLVPKITALRRDLEEYLAYYNHDRAHVGRLTQGRVPGEIVYGARKMGATR